MDLNAKWQWIDASQASELLNKARSNRPISKHHLKRLIEDMQSGEWSDSNPQPIIFDGDGYLVDGQHRLEAIRITGSRHRFLLINCDLNGSQNVLDSNRTRSAGDTLFMEGISDGVTKAAIANRIIKWERGGKSAFSVNTPTRLETVKRAKEDTLLSYVVNRLNEISGEKRGTVWVIPRATAGFLLYAFSTIDRAAAESFMKQFLTGYVDDKPSQILYLREHFLFFREKRRQMPWYETVFRSFKGWNLWRSGNNTSRIKYMVKGTRGGPGLPKLE